MKKILPFILTVFTFASCDTTKNQIITRENIESSVLKIKEDKNLDSAKINILDNLVSLSKGREDYIKARLKDLESEIIEKYVINDENFKENADNLFKYFLENKVTYKILLTEIDTLTAIQDKFSKRLEDVNKQIDDFCSKKQKEIDEKEKRASVIKDSLNKMVDIKIISIRETEIDYRDVVQVAIQMTNKTNKKIEAISFNLELTDKLGTKLATLGCRSNDGFSKSDVGYWVYDRWENDEIYKSLRNTNVSHVIAKQEITRLNIAGELISAYGDIDDYVSNLNYKTPKKLNGECPYLDRDDELNKKVDEENKRMSNEIKDKLNILSKYNEFSGKIFDFTKILG